MCLLSAHTLHAHISTSKIIPPITHLISFACDMFNLCSVLMLREKNGMLSPSSNYNLLYLSESHLYLNSAGGPECLRAWVYNVCVVYEVLCTCVCFHE